MVNINISLGFDTETKSIGLFSDGYLPAARRTYILHMQVMLKPDYVESLMYRTGTYLCRYPQVLPSLVAPEYQESSQPVLGSGCGYAGWQPTPQT